MLRSLKEVQGDDSIVGFYQATTFGAFFNQTLVETQSIHQEKLRHGGVVVVHGTSACGLVHVRVAHGPQNLDRPVADSAGQCIVPCISADERLLGRIQED